MVSTFHVVERQKSPISNDGTSKGDHTMHSCQVISISDQVFFQLLHRQTDRQTHQHTERRRRQQDPTKQAPL